MKLTPELIAQSPSALNAIKERQLDLRGHNIPVIENLGVTRDQHDCIDLTDNSLLALSNLPRMTRLRTLLLANNRISSISASLHLSAPNLTTLVLTNNALAELGELDPLKDLRKLKYLTLIGNPVREKKWYREWLAWRLPALRVLDFQKITDQERKIAKNLFLTPDNLPTALATSIESTKSTSSSKTPINAEEPRIIVPLPVGKAGRLMTKEDQARIRELIANAKTPEEITRLERSLKEGYVPSANAVGA